MPLSVSNQSVYCAGKDGKLRLNSLKYKYWQHFNLFSWLDNHLQPWYICQRPLSDRDVIKYSLGISDIKYYSRLHLSVSSLNENICNFLKFKENNKAYGTGRSNWYFSIYMYISQFFHFIWWKNWLPFFQFSTIKRAHQKLFRLYAFLMLSNSYIYKNNKNYKAEPDINVNLKSVVILYFSAQNLHRNTTMVSKIDEQKVLFPFFLKVLKTNYWVQFLSTFGRSCEILSLPA